jgi:hypothetical protein
VFDFTLDEQGTSLPRQYGPWTTFKTIELHHDEPYQGVDVSVCLDSSARIHSPKTETGPSRSRTRGPNPGRDPRDPIALETFTDRRPAAVSAAPL